MKFSYVFLVTLGFTFGSWIPFVLLPDQEYTLLIDGVEMVRTEKVDLTLLWILVMLLLNPFPWLMWAYTLNLLGKSHKELAQLEERHQSEIKLIRFIENHDFEA